MSYGLYGHSKENKYHAVRTVSSLCGRTFDSKLEARRGEELFYLQRAGVISDLVYQRKFVLHATKPRITVSIDFSYTENGVEILEDAKGVLTAESRVKYAWLQEKHGLQVRLKRDK